VNISFISETADFQLDNQDFIRKWLSFVANKETKQIGEIVYYFVNDKRIREVNEVFLDHHYLTDVITFDSSFLSLLNGEIYIGIEEVKRNSKDFSADNFNYELDRVMVHGLLHLIGYKDSKKEEKEEMSRKENYYLKIKEDIS
jgi:rRNA maturation RNase YbeY